MAHEHQPQPEQAPPGAAPDAATTPASAPSYTQVQPGLTGGPPAETGAGDTPLRQTQPGSTSNVEFAEPDLPAADEAVAPEDVRPMSADEFARDDPRRIYERMRPDQRTAIAGEFIRLLRLADDPDARRYDTHIDAMWPPERVAELHRYTQQHHPDIFADVLRHPVTRASLESPGVVVQTGSSADEKAVPGPVPDLPDKHDARILP